MNKSYTVKEKDHELFGKTLYTGRYCSTNYFLFCIVGKECYVLATKRGKGAADKQDKWCVPCGYLEDDESGEQGALRELYEETGIDMRDAERNVFLGSVTTNPKYCNNGNVQLNYYSIITNNELPDVSNRFDGNEVIKTEWVNIESISKDRTWCFGHDNDAVYIYYGKVKQFISL